MNRSGWTLLLSDMGAGKTATLSLLFLELSRLFLARQLPAVPVLVRLRDNWTPGDIEASLKRHVDEDILHRILARDFGVVLLLDGLDEFAMQFGHSLSVVQIADRVLQAPFLKHCAVVISTRPNVLSDLDRLDRYRHLFPKQYRLQDLQYTDVVDYVNAHNLKNIFDLFSTDVKRLLNKPLFLYFFVTAATTFVGPAQARTPFADEVQLYDWFFWLVWGICG